MKKILHIILVLCYTVSVTGMYVDLHFCSGDLAELTINYNYNDGCCCGDEEETTSCCSDENIYFKVSDNQKSSSQKIPGCFPLKTINPQVLNVSLAAFKSVGFSKFLERINIPPPNFQVSFCTFLI